MPWTAGRKKKTAKKTTSAKKSASHNGKTQTNVTATTTPKNNGAPAAATGAIILTAGQRRAYEKLIELGAVEEFVKIPQDDPELLKNLNSLRNDQPTIFVKADTKRKGRGFATVAAQLKPDVQVTTKTGGRGPSTGPRTPRQAQVTLTLGNLVAFTDALEEKVETEEAAVKKQLQAALKEAQALFNNNLGMGLGTKTLEENMKAVIKAREAIDDSSKSVLNAALRELAKEGKYPRELIAVMLGKT